MFQIQLKTLSSESSPTSGRSRGSNIEESNPAAAAS